MDEHLNQGIQLSRLPSPLWVAISKSMEDHFTVASPLSLNVQYLFLVGSSAFLSMAVQQLIVI